MWWSLKFISPILKTPALGLHLYLLECQTGTFLLVQLVRHIQMQLVPLSDTDARPGVGEWVVMFEPVCTIPGHTPGKQHGSFATCFVHRECKVSVLTDKKFYTFLTFLDR